ncbi:MAG: hypothetical protein GX620_12395 [Chloroflexi bacterium]|nr:hypothetical protein [Chloroflexota bacterium]
MDELTRYETWYGREELPPDCWALRAGPLTLEFESGDVRYVRFGQVELVRRVYVAIRDHNWNTIRGRMSNLCIDADEDHFTITFDSDHEAGDLRFGWRATITGSSDGVISYAMDGVAGSAFRYCRIGFCVLHPIRECAGRPYVAQTSDGPVAGELPLLIDPQLMENGLEKPMFPSFSDLTIRMEDGLETRFEFAGDLFEMEDQRNWTDGSFKTYCTPIALGYPFVAEKGAAFHQDVTLRVTPLPATASAAGLDVAEEPVRLLIGEPLDYGLPDVGLGMASHGETLSDREVALLRRLRPAHLRAELHFRDAQWVQALKDAIASAHRIGTRLELALFLDNDPEAEVAALRERLVGAPMARVLAFHESEAGLAATSPQWVALARATLGEAIPGIAIGGGTNGNFAEVNRAWPDTADWDLLSFTINPQVHATDERSLIEALEPQETTIQTARAQCGDLPICVSSVTLKPPFNQAATEEEAPPDPGELPPEVDPRQMSLFAAAWTVGSLRALISGGANSVTYYETTGWRGLLETERGSPLPNRFRSKPGMVFPVYYVFAALARCGGDGLALRTISDEPLALQGFAWRRGQRLCVLAANLLPSVQSVRLGPLPAGPATLLRLNESTASVAAFEPERFNRMREAWELAGGEIEVVLGPYETVFLEIEG